MHVVFSLGKSLARSVNDAIKWSLQTSERVQQIVWAPEVIKEVQHEY